MSADFGPIPLFSEREPRPQQCGWRRWSPSGLASGGRVCGIPSGRFWSGHYLNFCLFSVCKKDPWFAIIDPLIGKDIFVPPNNSFISGPQGVFLSWHGALQGPSNIALCVSSGTSEIQGHCRVCHATRRGPRTLSKTTGTNLIVC